MPKSKRDIQLYLDDIDSAIRKILKYVRGLTFEDFVRDELTADAVVRNLEIIGEAANNLPKKFREKHKEIPWSHIVGMRHKVIHEYYGVDIEILWATVKEDLVELRKQIGALL